MPMYKITDGRQADKIAIWLETIAAQIRARQTVVYPDRIFVAWQEGNDDDPDTMDVVHLDLTKTMCRKIESYMRHVLNHGNAADFNEAARLRSAERDKHLPN